ncbi:hypothetical protein C0214_11010 [Methylobacterium sp. DM1]|jgi:hypothetical protein|uniref:Uncharacterized protein n=1 Tax=Methylorubrum populi (strain ATCC BAA-705 / NCIMB 13946 / BJ001) TaxID=441620 RepID=B1ZJE2_METPB|nr:MULTISPECIES: hypothetical protein [Methylorubrum]ACB80045.1 hypothetical protein Mpop_1882 [Methylorubrum populi BJ001]AWI88734.1 hypothetical protein C0214_11010 [Methylobacterium sp. DM1]MBI1691964.1 hypothetical protein [Methylorubrum sp. DB1722]
MARPPSYRSFIQDLTDACRAWEEQYVSEASYAQFRRACAWVVDESVKNVSGDMRGATQDTFQDPTPWMVQGWQYRRSLAKNRDVGIVEAEAYLLPEQSTVMKYAMGDRRNVRLPGDVGLAQDRILLPHWRNLALTQGIRPNASHDLPGATMARLVRNSQGVYAKRSVPGRWGVYKGEVQVGGSRLMGYIARPPRVRAPVTDAGTQQSVFSDRRGKMKSPTRMVNLGRPRILLIEARQAEYRPIMQDPWVAANASARRNVNDLMARELAENIRHAGFKSYTGRLAALKAQAEQARARGDLTRSAHLHQDMSDLAKAMGAARRAGR